MQELKQESVRQGKTMSELVEAALRTLLQRTPEVSDLPQLPSFNTGGSRVNVANRDMLYDVMER